MLRSLKALKGLRVAAKDGSIGRVHDVLFEAGVWYVRYLEVETGLDIPDRRLLLPTGELAHTDSGEGPIHVNLTRDEVHHGPRFADDKPVSRQEEERLHSFFGWQPYWTDSDLPQSASEPPIPEGVEMTGDHQDESVPSERLPVGDPNLYAAGEVVGYQIEAEGGLAGKVADFILDELWMVRYLAIDTGPETGHKQVLLASHLVDRISFDTFSVYADIEAELVKDGPAYDPTAPINEEFENILQDYFGY